MVGQYGKEELRNVRNIVWRKLDGKRKRGKPKKRWRKAVEEDLTLKPVKIGNT